MSDFKIPKNQTLWVTYKDEHGKTKQIITSDEMRKNTIYIMCPKMDH